MSRFLLWLERVRDMLATPTFRALVSPGNFRTEYPNGERTYWMDYRSASNLRDVFGGRVVHRNQVAQSNEKEGE